MNPQAQSAKLDPAPTGEEKRKNQRYRFINNIYVCKQNGSWHRAMTYEISLGGLSVAMVTELSLGEIVRLSPIAGKEVYAVVRRRKGTMYGFEFLKLSTWLREQIQKMCDSLPPFTSLTDV
jgi:c-di-GMP-binding flagellar brake protein YcgR